jgi:hypothetical protein
MPMPVNEHAGRVIKKRFHLFFHLKGSSKKSKGESSIEVEKSGSPNNFLLRRLPKSSR